MNASQTAGFAGIALGFIAYLPQVAHLIRERCSAGISRRAYVLWSLASLLLLVRALAIRDEVFLALQTLNIASNALVLGFAERYKDGACPLHRPARQAR